MKQLSLLFTLISLMVSCQSNDYGSYKISWMGLVIVGIVGSAMFLILVLKEGVDKEAEPMNHSNAQHISHKDFEPMGNYLGGHPGSENMITSAVFRKNSNCCLFFYKDGSYSMPEFKFKIKIKSFKNIFVDDLSSFEEKVISGRIKLTSAAGKILKKNKSGKMAFVTINWTDGQSEHSTVFSFEGKDSLEKANTARGNFLQSLN
jgi:hypothetical protein